MKRCLMLVSALMTTIPMIAMEEQQQQMQQTQPQLQQPSSQTDDGENIFQKALYACCDSSCCAVIKYPLLTLIYSPIFMRNNIRYPNGGRTQQ